VAAPLRHCARSSQLSLTGVVSASTSRTTDVVSKDRNQGKNQLRVGRLVKAHGLKGALKLELYTDNPERRFVPGAEFTLQVPEASPWHGKTVTVREYRVMNGNPVVFFNDVEDRDGAEGLVRAILWIDQDVDEVEENAWFDHQLVGLDVVRDGIVLGKVARVDHFPAQDLLIVKTPGGEVLVPFVQAIVPTVDVAAGHVIVTPPAGLFEELPDADDKPDTEESAEAVADASE
jgi:16S rRNA processing protein RimM